MQNILKLVRVRAGTKILIFILILFTQLHIDVLKIIYIYCRSLAKVITTGYKQPTIPREKLLVKLFIRILLYDKYNFVNSETEIIRLVMLLIMWMSHRFAVMVNNGYKRLDSTRPQQKVCEHTVALTMTQQQ